MKIGINRKGEIVLQKEKINNSEVIYNRGAQMKISYNKLWKLLIDKKMSKAELRKAVELSPNTMTKMRKDEEVSMSVLLKIANYLDCDISDMCEFIKGE